MPLPYTFGCNDKICRYAKCEKPERFNCEAYNWAVNKFKEYEESEEYDWLRKLRAQLKG
ncbi:unnamed protein product [marine sediment metagenome]|uniref:Uncharacterized protein n=1 Tax=marine sediment metagenome TaxID=412755 RepID=X1Q3N0_9ZZZZ